MKNIHKILIFLFAGLMQLACDNGIDPITQVDPGQDAAAPVVTITYPTEGASIKVPEAVSSITIEFEVTDDIEVGSIIVHMDGKNIGNYSDFKDYRRVLVDDLVYSSLTDGSHELTVSATDLDGKTTSSSVNFEKEPAYTPLFAGETLYMPFDGDYTDLVGFTTATEVGSPGFAGESVLGTNAYAGAPDSYLTMPTTNLQLGPEFSAAFWYKPNADPDLAGILVISPPDEANPGEPNNRTSGFRLFREGGATNQVIKLNVGTGAGESWFDGGAAATIDPTNAGWIHLAFSISASEATVYIDGEIVSQGAFTGIDWTGGDIISIGSGAPRFTGWGHNSDNSFIDELRLFNTALTQTEVQNMIVATNPYTGEFDGEMFYMPFDGTITELFSGSDATMVGTTGFAGVAVEGDDAFAGATDSYLTFPSAGLTPSEFSATFWYNVNAAPDRAGILVMGPEDTERPEFPAIQNLRTNGFRFFREGDATNQVFKLNVGDGTADSWFDGGATASLDPATAGWVHMAFTISGTECAVYFDGEVVAQGTFSGVDWSGCDLLSIGSGAPRFTEWGHLSDLSYMDELWMYNKALTQEEIQDIRNSDL